MKDHIEPIQSDFGSVESSDIDAVSFVLYDRDVFPTPASEAHTL